MTHVAGLPLTTYHLHLASGADETEAKIVVPVPRVVVVPVRRTQVLGVVVPAAAAFHAVSPRRSAYAVHYYGNYGNAQ